MQTDKLTKNIMDCIQVAEDNNNSHKTFSIALISRVSRLIIGHNECHTHLCSPRVSGFSISQNSDDVRYVRSIACR